MLWSLTGEGGKVSRVVIGNCTFFIRNHFIRNVIRDSLKFKKPLELHEKS